MTQGGQSIALGAPIDVITHNPGDLVRREQVRDLGAGVVTAIFRIVKLATLHAMDNQAIVRQLDDTVAIVAEYGARTGTNVSILFAHGSIFVGGQLLKANRGVYDGASELGAVLLRCGVAELTIAKDARKADIQTFASVIAEATRGGRPQNLERPTPRIRLRAASDAALARGMTVERLTPDQEIVRTYASAIVIMRRFYDALARGQYYLPQRVKRIAQSLVDLSAGETPAFLGVTAVRNANHDEAGRAVNTTILSLAIARQITSDALSLVRIAMAALLFDTGRSRLVGVRPGGGIVPGLSEKQDADMPAATAVVLTALGRVNEPSVMRTVMTYEAHWVKRQGELGAPYRGLRQATIQARIVAVARSFNDLLTPQPGLDPLSADEAIARLEADAVEAVDRTVLRLLVGALGIFPTGTLVELSTGEVALVVATPPHPALYSQPRVRLVFSAGGGAIERAVDIDLAVSPSPGEPPRHIVRVVAMADEAGPEMRALAKHGTVAPPTSGVRTPLPIAPGPVFSRAAPTERPEPLSPASSPPSSTGPRSPTTLQSARAQTSRPEVKPITLAPPRDVAVFESGVDMDEHDQSTRAIEYDKSYLSAADAEDAAASSDRVSDVPEAPISSDRAPASPAAPKAQAPQPSVAAGAPAAATAEGTLTRTPLVHLLVYLLDQRLTGSVVFQTPEGAKHCIYLQDGVPSKIQTGAIIAPLDRVILDMGLLDERTLRETLLEVSKKRMLHGRHLVLKGLLDRDTVLGVLHAQLVRKLTALFDLPSQTVYAYYEGVNLLASYGGPELTPCEPLAVVMAGVRMRAQDPLVDATLERLAGRPLALHLDADVRRFDLVKQETAVVDLLRARRMTLADLLAAGVAPERVVRLTVYALMISRHLDLGVAGRPPVGIVARERSQVSQVTAPPKDVTIREGAPPRPPPADPAAAQPVRGRTAFGLGFGQTPKQSPQPASSSSADGDPPSSRRDPLQESTPIAAPPIAAPSAASSAKPVVDFEARRAEIEKRFASIDDDDHYALLGVLDDATPAQIQAAYFGLAKSWHPDRMPAELADLKPHVSKIFGRVNDAYQTLSDPQKRAAYVEKLKRGTVGAEEQAHVTRVVDAALDCQKAEVLLKKHDLAGAEELARRAVAADPDQPEYLTLLVWIQALRRGDPPEGKAAEYFDELIKTLDLILLREPRYERALFYRGMLLKRSGKNEASMRDFRLAAEINPKNIDAVREVRLFEMRKQKAEPSQPGKTPESTGLFGKFFKK